MTTLIQGVVDGVLIGGVYAVVAVGLTLLFGVVKIVNFAHGAMVMAAAYAAHTVYVRWALEPYVAMPALVAIFFVIGVAYYLIFLRRLVGESLLGQALFTIGVALVLGNGALAVFGPDIQTMSLAASLRTFEVAGITIEYTRLVAFLAALVTTISLAYLLWRTDFGIQVRAAASDPETAELVGIRTRRVHAIASGLSIACAAVGGVVLLPILFVSPQTGDQFIFLAFLIIILGGLGSFFGALAGGVIIGVTQSLGSTYFDGSIAQLMTFLLFVLVLLFKPNGLFARESI